MPCNDSDAPTMPTGVWRRARWDWAYRIVIPDYGSVMGLGFSTREKAREAMTRARKEYGSRAALPGTDRTDG